MYLALVSGCPSGEIKKIDFPLSKNNNMEKVIVDYQNGLDAITYLNVLGSSDKISLVSLFPITGRTHQLRVHMAEIGHPIVGDRKYGSFKLLIPIQKQKINLQLHCFQLIFPNEINQMELTQAPINKNMLNNTKLLGLDKYIPSIGKAHFH